MSADIIDFPAGRSQEDASAELLQPFIEFTPERAPPEPWDEEANMPNSPYMRAIVEAQEEAQDDRTDVQKLHDACRLRVDTKARLDALVAPGASVVDVLAFKEADQADDRALAEICWLLENQFGDEVDIELLAKALAS